jgi:hypothetical protein
VYTFVENISFTITTPAQNGKYICGRIIDGTNKTYVKSTNVLNVL